MQFFRVIPLLTLQTFLLQQLRQTRDRIQRRADFMADIGKENGFGTGSGIGLFFGLLQFLLNIDL